MSKDSTIWLFGKPYFWTEEDGVLVLIADYHLTSFFPRATARDSARSRARVEHQFVWDLTAGKSTLAAQAALYAELLRSETCSRCGKPALPHWSVEVDPLCPDCLSRQH